jgi:allophanate hydrolase
VFRTLGAQIIDIDMEPFYRAARLLYEGPWVAERYIVARSVIETTPQSMHPITRQIIAGGARHSAADAFAAFYQLQELRRACDRAFTSIDALALPTVPRAYRVDEMLADPIDLNGRLGTYTNFVNLFDLCALSVPAAILPEGVPFGVTLIGRAGEDAALAAIGGLFHAETELPMGATGKMQPALGPEA